jgi:hypothetical protein
MPRWNAIPYKTKSKADVNKWSTASSTQRPVCSRLATRILLSEGNASMRQCLAVLPSLRLYLAEQRKRKLSTVDGENAGSTGNGSGRTVR